MIAIEFILAGMLAAATPFLLAALGELVAERSGGEFTMNISYGGLSGNRENLDGISIGAFEMAVRNGAEFIVGPLLKNELADLAAAELPPVPGLALNWADDGASPPGYVAQFALAPEDDPGSRGIPAGLLGLAQAPNPESRRPQHRAAAFLYYTNRSGVGRGECLLRLFDRTAVCPVG